jgi:hypothetical protein
MEARTTESRSNNFNVNAALITVGLGLLLAICLPAYLATKPAWHPWPWLGLPPLDFMLTGQIGDTIGGIAGPILNFVGLLVVYFSLREQTRASNQQFQQSQRETTLELFFKLLAYLEQQLTKNNEALKVLNTHLNVLELSYGDKQFYPDGPKKAEAGKMIYPPVGFALAEIAKVERPLQLVFGLFQTVCATLNQSELDKITKATMYQLLASAYVPVTDTIQNRPIVAGFDDTAKTIQAQLTLLTVAAS